MKIVTMMPSNSTFCSKGGYDVASAAKITPEENDMTADIQFQPHPLLMDHIIENILLSMDPPDLLGHHCKIFRLVCKDWNDAATRVYKAKRGRITFKRNFVRTVSGLFIRVMKTSSNIPFQNFKFCSDSYDDSYFDELLHVCGSAMSTLDLSIVNPCALKFPKTFPHLVLGRLRKLVFHVRLDSYEPIQTETEMASLLESLFKISPNLESLDLKVLRGVSRHPLALGQHNPEMSLQALAKLGDVLAGQLPQRITDLKLQITLTEAQLRTLTRRRLNLKKLDIYLQQSQVSSEALEEFFRKCGPNLVSCKVIGNQFLHQIIKFPVFPRLRVLSAFGRAPPYLSYSKLFPGLEKLEICLWDSFDDIFPPNCYSPSLSHVNFPYQVGSRPIFERMAGCFPNLRILTEITITSPEALTSLFQSLRSLEKLDICLGYDFQSCGSLDAIFSGMMKNGDYYSPSIPSINGTKYNEELVREDIERNFNTRDSIRNLKELRYLSIMAAPLTLPSSAKITDMSVYYGFLQLKKLAVIKLDYFPISIPCIEILRKQVQLIRPVL